MKAGDLGLIISGDLISMSDMDKNSGQLLAFEDRLTSIDVFRGVTMFLLVGEATGLSEHHRVPQLSGTVLGRIGWQFEHHPWNGLHFWDLIQPFFMFIVGVAMPFSIGKRWQRGDSWGKTFRHALARSELRLAPINGLV
jgi:predicted acyltransferase